MELVPHITLNPTFNSDPQFNIDMLEFEADEGPDPGGGGGASNLVVAHARRKSGSSSLGPNG